MKLSIPRQYKSWRTGELKGRSLQRVLKLGPLHIRMGQNRATKPFLNPYRVANLDLYLRIISFHAYKNNEGSWGAWWKFPRGWQLSSGFSCYGDRKGEHCDIRGHFVPQLNQWDRSGDRMLRSISIYGIDLGKY